MKIIYRPHVAVRIIVILYLMCMLAFSMVVPAYAAGVTGIEAVIESGTRQVIDLLRAFVISIAVVVIAISGLSILFGGQRGMEYGKKGMLTGILVILAVLLIQLVFKAVTFWFNTVVDSSVFG